MKKRSEAVATSGKKASDLELLVQAVAAEYPDDPSGAGVALAHLKTGEFYVAVHRFTEKWGGGKKVVCSSKGNNLEETIAAAARLWLGQKSAKKRLAPSVFDDDYEGVDRADGYGS